jgi:hypothetical protein
VSGAVFSLSVRRVRLDSSPARKFHDIDTATPQCYIAAGIQYCCTQHISKPDVL